MQSKSKRVHLKPYLEFYKNLKLKEKKKALREKNENMIFKKKTWILNTNGTPSSI